MNKLLQAYNKVKLFLYLFFRIQYLIFKGIFVKNKTAEPGTFTLHTTKEKLVESIKTNAETAHKDYLKWWNENVPNPENPVRLRDKQLTSADFPSENHNPLTKEDIDRLYTMHLFVKRNRPLEEREKSMDLFKDGEVKERERRLQKIFSGESRDSKGNILERLRKTFAEINKQEEE
jgi:hypothetical protein